MSGKDNFNGDEKEDISGIIKKIWVMNFEYCEELISA